MTSILNRSRRILGACILGAAALAAVGCGSSRQQSWSLAVPETSVLSEGPAVDIENHRGSVEVRVEPWRSDIEVSVATNISGDHSGERARTIRDGMLYEAGSRSEDGPPVLHVRAVTAMPDDADHSTRILVRMPSCGGVRIQTRDGAVHVIGAGGAMQIENTDGSIEVRTDRPITSPALLSATRGDIRWSVPLASSAALEAETGEGRIILRNPAAGQSDWTATWTGQRKVVGSLNSGSNAVSIRTLSGDINIDIRENPLNSAALMR